MKYSYLALILLIIALPSCVSSVRFSESDGDFSGNSKDVCITEKETNDKEYKGKKIKGLASYYADKFHGRTTASGEKYYKNKMTAAHKTLPFGTKVAVKNLRNGKQVIVKINDRGPFVKGRIIDLSRAAAEEIDMIRSGVVEVEITILD